MFFWVRDDNILPKKELYKRVWVKMIYLPWAHWIPRLRSRLKHGSGLGLKGFEIRREEGQAKCKPFEEKGSRSGERRDRQNASHSLKRDAHPKHIHLTVLNPLNRANEGTMKDFTCCTRWPTNFLMQGPCVGVFQEWKSNPSTPNPVLQMPRWGMEVMT